MEYSRFGNQIVVRLDQGDEISASVLKIAEAEDISLASVSGIGATNDIDVGVYDIDAKEYTRYTFRGTHEITSLIGNLTRKDGKPYAHMHVTLAGDGGKIVGGHLLRGVIVLTSEIFITVVDGKAERKYDAGLGINRLSFEEDAR